MPTETPDHLRRWATYGITELQKELGHLRQRLPGCAAIPDLEQYLAEREAEAERTYGGRRLEQR